MRNYCLLVGVLNTDRQADVALGLVMLDHNANLRPDAALVHAGIDIRVDVIRQSEQNIAQQGILIKVPSPRPPRRQRKSW